jgi:hypothetical protein
MADCELLPKCLYFNDKLEKMPTASEGVKSMYCRWHYEECARYMVAYSHQIHYGQKKYSPNITELINCH